MSNNKNIGREYRKFAKQNTTEDDRLTKQLLVSLKKELPGTPLHVLVDKRRVKPVDYALCRHFIQERKEAASSALDKVRQLEERGQAKRDALLMKLHGHVWLKEWQRLRGACKSVEAELEDLAKLLEHNSVHYMNMTEIATIKEEDENQTTDDDVNDEQKQRNQDNENNNINDYFSSLRQIDALEDYAERLDTRRVKFVERTVNPLLELKEDLEYYVRTTNGGDQTADADANRQILCQISHVKRQQEALMSSLEQELDALDNDMRDVTELTEQLRQDEMHIEQGIPQEAYELDCPNDELKASVLQEFLIVDYKYSEKLRQLEEAHADNRNDWPQRQHELFQHVYEQYMSQPASLVANSNVTLRELIFDRVQRQLNVDRATLVKHEEHCQTAKYLQQQRRLVTSEWLEARRALLLRAEAAFHEAYELMERERARQDEKERQRRVCAELYDKVSRWREQRLEALEIKQRLDELAKRGELERLKRDEERKRKQREKDKQDILDYNRRVNEHRDKLERDEKQRLDKLNKLLAEQSVRDQERIDYRKRLYAAKKAEVARAKEAKEHAAEMKEMRIERFLESVKPHVSADPARLASFTQSELNKRGVYNLDLTSTTLTSERDLGNNNNNGNTSSNCFKQHFGFTEKQLNADARVRVEQRLRQAGLVNSDYARALLGQLKPPTQPRPDLRSNPGWNGLALK